jgi:hypothetical protein
MDLLHVTAPPYGALQYSAVQTVQCNTVQCNIVSALSSKRLSTKFFFWHKVAVLQQDDRGVANPDMLVTSEGRARWKSSPGLQLAGPELV